MLEICQVLVQVRLSNSRRNLVTAYDKKFSVLLRMESQMKLNQILICPTQNFNKTRGQLGQNMVPGCVLPIGWCLVSNTNVQERAVIPHRKHRNKEWPRMFLRGLLQGLVVQENCDYQLSRNFSLCP